MTIKIVPMLGTARNTGVKTQIFIRIGINTFVGIVSAGLVTDTNRMLETFDFDGFRTEIFEAGRAVFASANAVIAKGSFVNGAKWRTIEVEIGVSSS